MNMPTKFEVRIFTCSWDNRGVFYSPWISPRSKFLQNFYGLLFGCTLRMYRPNLKCVALPVREIIAIEVLGGGCEPPILGEEEAVGGRGWYRSKERW